MHDIAADRASLACGDCSYAEMVVPYGDPRTPHFRKCAFDAGEDGLGRNCNSLELGCDCLGLIHYFDAHMVADSGEVETVSRAVCMHEEDDGTLLCSTRRWWQALA